jgi:hypothetical protein
VVSQTEKELFYKKLNIFCTTSASSYCQVHFCTDDALVVRNILSFFIQKFFLGLDNTQSRIDFHDVLN